MDFLEEQDEEKHAALAEEYKETLANEDYDSEDSDWLLEALFDALNEIAPRDHYFGSHPGDGADYGFWEAEEF